jgi:hypothetical protein
VPTVPLMCSQLPPYRGCSKFWRFLLKKIKIIKGNR